MQGDLMRSRSDGMQWRKTAREVWGAAGRRTWAVELDATTGWGLDGGIRLGGVGAGRIWPEADVGGFR